MLTNKGSNQSDIPSCPLIKSYKVNNYIRHNILLKLIQTVSFNNV